MYLASANRYQSDTKDRSNNMSVEHTHTHSRSRTDMGAVRKEKIVVDTTEILIESHRQSFTSVFVPCYRFIDIVRAYVMCRSFSACTHAFSATPKPMEQALMWRKAAVAAASRRQNISATNFINQI